jgi:hypothetical protein
MKRDFTMQYKGYTLLVMKDKKLGIEYFIGYIFRNNKMVSRTKGAMPYSRQGCLTELMQIANKLVERRYALEAIHWAK